LLSSGKRIVYLFTIFINVTCYILHSKHTCRIKTVERDNFEEDMAFIGVLRKTAE